MDIQNDTTCHFYFIEWKTKNPSNGKKNQLERLPRTNQENYRMEDRVTPL